MKKILENLALIHLIEFGKKNLIDVSGTHLAKNGRGFKWDLIKDETKLPIITIQFYKNNIPTFIIYN